MSDTKTVLASLSIDLLVGDSLIEYQVHLEKKWDNTAEYKKTPVRTSAGTIFWTVNALF